MLVPFKMADTSCCDVSDMCVFVADQEKELNDLHDILEEQKGEIERLNAMLDRIEPPAQGASLYVTSFKHNCYILVL